MTRLSRTILIVDDSLEDQELYRRYLQQDPDYSYTILEAALGRQGLELWQQQRPDLVLLDYRLSDLDGLEFLAQLPSPLPQPCLPVIVMTGQGNEAIAVQAMKAGALDYLIKGQITPEGLYLAINGAIETVQLRTELQQRIERERLIGQITRQIYQSLDLDRILDAAVTEVRQFLNTDRVLVFQVQPDGNGTVVAESVGENWRSLLSSTINDPCLAENYIRFSRSGSITYDSEFVENHVNRYRQGQVTAIPDIHTCGSDSCHIELLAQFQVNANLVVPILHDDRFWGLLIVHHCGAPRLWQPLEIDLLKELATHLGIALRQAELYQQSQSELAERNRVETELRESEERLRSALEASRMGTWDWNIQTGQIQWSDNLEAMFGLERGAFDGSFEMFASFLHPDDRDRVLAAIEHVIATGEDYNVEFRVVYPNGRIRWALNQGKVFYDRNGLPVRMAGNDIDITERKQAEEALQASEERFRQLAENIDVVFWTREATEPRVSYISPAYERLWGLNPQELYVDPQVWIDHIHPDDREVTDRAFHEKAALGQFDQEYRIVLANGQTRWVHDRCFALQNQSGEIYRFTGIAEDITDRKRSEQDLRESEERFRTSIENMLDCFAIYQAIRNEQGKIVDFRTEYVNDAACLNNQMTREQQIGRGLCELLPGHRDSGLFDEYCQVVETGQSLVKDSLVYEDDYGQQRLIRAFDIRVAKFGDGYIATWRDITERKQIEESLRENEQLLRLALAGAQAGFWDWEIATGKVTWSPENYALYGVEPATTTPCYEIWYNALHPDDREAVNAVVTEVISQRLPEFRSEFRIIHPQLGLRWLLGLGQLVLDDQGNPLRLSGINLDITDRIHAEEALRQSEERFRTLADNMSQLAWMAHANGDIFWYNQRWFNYTGITLEEGQGWGWQKVHHPDHVDRVVQHIRYCFETGQLWEDTFPLRGQDGQYRWFLSRAIPIRNEQGEITCWFGTNTDITDRQQSEIERDRLLEQEQVARESAERANRIKDEFLAVLSHELRSPLNPILGWARLLQTRQFDSAKTAEALATIERNAKLQTQLIDDLLDVAKILRGKFSMDTAPIDLVFVIEAAIDTVRAAAVAKDITLHAVLPQIGQVSGDSVRLQQIVWNLLSNAIKFTSAKGQVEVRLEREDNQAKITVSDTGKGINPDFLPHIFESFRQEDASTTRQYGGLGLGLAIVRHLVEAHGGTICANSPGEGQGATFIVQFPLLDAESKQPTSEVVSINELDLTGMRILVVDDELDARELLNVLLTESGAQVLVVASAAEVLTNLESFQPDVLISDIGMPQMDGYVLMQQIRALPPEKGGQILAIALTAYAREEDYQQAINNGYQRHLVKPLDPNQLVQVVMELTRQTTSE